MWRVFLFFFLDVAEALNWINSMSNLHWRSANQCHRFANVHNASLVQFDLVGSYSMRLCSLNTFVDISLHCIALHKRLLLTLVYSLFFISVFLPQNCNLQLWRSSHINNYIFSTDKIVDGLQCIRKTANNNFGGMFMMNLCMFVFNWNEEKCAILKWRTYSSICSIVFNWLQWIHFNWWHFEWALNELDSFLQTFELL